MPGPSGSPSPGLDRADLVLACASALAAALAAWSLGRAFLVGDGAAMVTALALSEPRLWWHVLPLPLARLLGASFGLTPFESLAALGSLAALVAVPATFLAARFLDRSRPAALAAAAVFALSPGFWFHATVIEVHALHAAHVALVLAVLAGQRRGRTATSWRASLLAVAAIASLVLSHRSAPLIAPGLAVVATLGVRDELRLGRAVAMAGASVALGLGLDALLHALIGGPSVASQAGLAAFDYGDASPAELFLGECLLPAGLLAIGFAGLLLPGGWLWRGLALAAWPYPLAVVALGVPTDGGYVLPAVAVAALGLARVVDRSSRGERGRALLAAALIALQAWAGWSLTQTSARLEAQRLTNERVARLLPALPEDAALLSVHNAKTSLCGRGRGVVEFDLTPPLRAAAGVGAGLDLVAREAATLVLVAEATTPGPVLWSREWRAAPEELGRLVPYLEAVEAMLLERFSAQPHGDPELGLWRLGAPSR